MILFYSEYCKHCEILLETIKRHDKDNIIKLVSIDLLRSLKKPIDPKIHSVPALLILETREYLFGKAVFDYLLLPNRGVLFNGSVSTRTEKKGGNSPNDNSGMTNKELSLGEPSAFSLGAISSENYASLNDDDSMRTDTNYKWELIDDKGNQGNNQGNMLDINRPENSKFDDKKSKLPTMEDIMKQRAMDIK